MFCYNCGKQIPDGTKFCRYCGASQNAVQTPSANSQEAAPASTPTSAPAPAPTPAASANRPETATTPQAAASSQKAAPQPTKTPKKSPLGVVIAVAVALVAFVLGRYVLAPGMKGSRGTNPSSPSGSSSSAGADDSDVEYGTTINIYGTEPAPQSDTLGDSWDSYTIEINGKVLTFPCTLDDLKQTGAYIREDQSEDKMVDAYGSDGLYYRLGYGDLVVSFANGYDEPKPIRECLVIGVEISYGTSISVVLPGGIVVGEDTPEELERVYGPPTSTLDHTPHYQEDVLWRNYIWQPDPDSSGDGLYYCFNVTEGQMVNVSIGRPKYDGQGTDIPSDARENPSGSSFGEESGYENRETNDAYYQALSIIGYQSPTPVLVMTEGLKNPTLESFVRDNGDGSIECCDYAAEGDVLAKYYETILLDLSVITAEQKEQIVGDLKNGLPELEKLDFVAADYKENGDGTVGILTFSCTGLDKEENRRILCDMGVFDEDGSWSISEIKDEITSFGYISKYK